MPKLTRILLLLIPIALLWACHPYEEFDNTAEDNLDALWTVVDQHYCFFAEKDVDWDAVKLKYQQRLADHLQEHKKITVLEYFDLMADMLDELQDGHVNLISPFDRSSYQKWWTDYPQDFNLRTLQQYYLDFDYRVTSGIYYKMLPDSIGYIYYPSFNNRIGEGNLDYIMQYLHKAKGLIIDVRNNGGGEMTNIETIVGRFITEPVVTGYISHKTGPGHDQFSKPYPIEYKPAREPHVMWNGTPVVVLTNRSCYSAANDFVSVMKQLPGVRIVGARTGGGGGIPFTAELPIGWKVRFSACPVTDAQGNSIETGIDPNPGCEVHCTPEQLAQGQDAILDFALHLLITNNSATNN